MTKNQPKNKKKKDVLDYSVTKECEVCMKQYHPRNNGYQTTSRFCSQQCSVKGRRISDW